MILIIRRATPLRNENSGSFLFNCWLQPALFPLIKATHYNGWEVGTKFPIYKIALQAFFWSFFSQTLRLQGTLSTIALSRDYSIDRASGTDENSGLANNEELVF